jgi:hypothetical protein
MERAAAATAVAAMLVAVAKAAQPRGLRHMSANARAFAPGQQMLAALPAIAPASWRAQP